MSEYQTAAGLVSQGVVPESKPGTPYSSTNPLPVTQTGSTGQDFSANQPTLPNLGAAFGGSGPYAGYVQVKAIAANPARALIDVENNSGAQILVLRDDGTVSTGALVNASVFPLAGGAGPGSQGGSWSSTSFKGRIQVYAPSGTSPQVAVFQD